MPFEFYNAPITFQRLMNLSFVNMVNHFVTVYFDDILVYSETEDEHLTYLRKVFEKTRESQLC